MKVQSNVVADVDAIIARLSSLGAEIVPAAAEAAAKEGDYELALTRERVPIGPTGQLRLSGRREGPDFDGTNLTVNIAYGGPAGAGMNTMDVDYAVYVHENLEAHHPIGQAKFIESVVREELESGAAAGRMGQDIIDFLDRGLVTGAFKSRGGSWVRGAGGRFAGSKS